MPGNQTDSATISNSESSIAYTPSPTSPTVTTNLDEQDEIPPPLSSVPSPSSSFLIQSVLTGMVITYHEGRVVLAPLGGHDMTRWQCVQNGGWLGFRDPASHHFLGYDKNEDLCCDARNQSVWENFCVRQRPDEGYLLLMIHYDNWTKIAWSELRPVGTTVEGGSGKLALVDEWQSDATAWRFIRV